MTATLGCISLQAQIERDFSIKLYNQFNHSGGSQIQSSTSGLVRDTSVMYSFTINSLSLSPAFRWSSGARYSQEVAVTRFSYKSLDDNTVVSRNGGTSIPVGGARTSAFSLGLRYEFANCIAVFKEEGKFGLELGVALSPGVSVVDIKPVTSNTFPSRETSFSLDVLMIPRLKYKLNDNWVLDLNAAIYGAEVVYEVSKLENPVFPANEQEKSVYSQNLLPKRYEIRLGIGYHL